ncbi:MAG: 8-amino-7-oxononanoate synthase [Gammaproteobacteria bacterium]|nr:MAG: 8-amino-7-oxononanoate synthase [Gammaproteobacteria bacterium]RLA56001.1 MAG: 8-amino-7-oxononanoate synthase [Gammaproteobacteria bacterium]HDY83181.1 8-amino-7-oxononanoate synthase [Halieaceae bacterium]
MEAFSERLSEVLARRDREGLYRYRLTLESAQGPLIQLAGRQYLNFCSNDYLGLAAHPKVIEALRRAAVEYGVGSGASHLVCGHSTPHHQLEEALAEFTGRPRALLFSSGYMANTGILTSLLQRGDYVFEDRLNHASLLDGGLHSGARFQRYRHNDVAALAAKLKTARGPKLVVVDGVFSMDGDTAPLAELAALCSAQQAWLMVDDAHGFGVMGERGAGSTEAAGLDADSVPVLMATLGKALGTAGAFVAGSELLIEGLIQQARNYIYTTALPPAVAAASLAALQLLREESWRRHYLKDLIVRFRSGAQQLSLPLMESASAIQPLLVGDAGRAMNLSEQLRDRGLLISAIRPPTVPAGTSRLRITLSAAHSEEQIDRLLEHLGACWPGA